MKNEKVETATDISRSIPEDEEIWEVEGNSERGRFLSTDDQLGTIELELKRPLKLSDREEDMPSLKVNAPTMDDIDKTQGNAKRLLQRCVPGIDPKDMGTMHGADYIRLQKLVRHFLA